MQVSVESIGSLGRKLVVSIPADRLESAVGTRLREMARSARINGFRPGRVPVRVIEQRFGAKVRSEAYSEILRESFGAALREQNLLPLGQPEINAEHEITDALRYTATFEVAPEFGDIEIETLAIKRPVANVDDTDVERMIETLRQQRGSWNEVARPAGQGDLVSVDTNAVAGEQRFPAVGAERAVTVIGSNMLLPQIESALVGMKAGDTAAVEVQFPSNWRVAELSGRAALVTLQVERVSERHLPMVDAAFIQSFGVRSGAIADFRAEVRGNLQRELRGAISGRLRAEVAQKLVETYGRIELPPRLIEAEARSLAQAAAEHAARQAANAAGTAPEAAADVKNADPAPFLTAARNRVAAGLIVTEIARRNNLRLEQRRVEEAIAVIASTYEEPQQVVELYRNDPQLLSGLQARVMEEQVIDWIAARAQATEVALSFSDALRQST